MVSFEKFQSGVIRFIETEITAQFTGWKKVVAETAVGLYISQIPHKIQELSQNPLFAGMGIVSGNQVDVEKLYNELSKHFKQPVPVEIPMLGTANFTKENLDTLYTMILNA